MVFSTVEDVLRSKEYPMDAEELGLVFIIMLMLAIVIFMLSDINNTLEAILGELQQQSRQA